MIGRRCRTGSPQSPVDAVRYRRGFVPIAHISIAAWDQAYIVISLSSSFRNARYPIGLSVTIPEPSIAYARSACSDCSALS